MLIYNGQFLIGSRLGVDLQGTVFNRKLAGC